MTLLRAPLPLKIDSTMISCFRSCPQKFYKEFVRGFRPPGLSIDLHAGSCFALAIEATYRGIWQHGLPLNAALERAHGAFALAWGTFEIPEYKRTAKTFDRVWDAVLEYFQLWDPHLDHVQPYFAADGKPTFEYTFAIPLDGPDFPTHPSGDPFLYCGRFDMLGSLGGSPCIRDEKTTGASISDKWSEKWDLRNQFIGYCWACQQAEIETSTVVVRGISILKTKIGLQEATKVYSQDLISRWYEQLRLDLYRMVRCYAEGYFDYNFAETCTAYGNCIFMTACGAPESEQESWLSQFEVRHWDPTHKNPVGKEELA